MTICRVVHNKKNPYIIINKTIVSDPDISWKAKGLWLYAFSRPDDWTFYEKDLVCRGAEGRIAIRSGLRELEEARYLEKKQYREGDGKFSTSEWIWYEDPCQEREKEHEEPEFKKRLPKSGFLTSGNRTSGSLDNPYRKTNYIIKELPTKPSAEEVEKDEKVVVVPSFLSEIEGLPQSLAEKLLASYPKAVLQEACEMLRDSDTYVEKPYGWIRACIEGEYKRRESFEEVVNRNKAFLGDVLHRYDGKVIFGYRIEIRSRSVDIFSVGCQSSKGASFDVESRTFEVDVRSYIKTLQNKQQIAKDQR